MNIELNSSQDGEKGDTEVGLVKAQFDENVDCARYSATILANMLQHSTTIWFTD